MSQSQRPLQGCAVGISISESDDSIERGFPSWQVNRVTLQLVVALFGQGAGVVFGHDWREDGVMEAVHGFALQMQPSIASVSGTTVVEQPLLRNLLPWPDKPRLDPDERKRLASTLSIEEAGLPSDLVGTPNRSAGNGNPQYVRARALTHLRHLLTKKIDARVSFGGRTGGSQGRYPGIIEEALFAFQERKPLYAAGLLGGATQQIIDAVQGGQMPPDFCHASKTKELFADQAGKMIESDGAAQADLVVDPPAVWDTFKHAGLSGLSEANKLSEEENLELFHTAALDRAINLILLGLARVSHAKRA